MTYKDILFLSSITKIGVWGGGTGERWYKLDIYCKKEALWKNKKKKKKRINLKKQEQITLADSDNQMLMESAKKGTAQQRPRIISSYNDLIRREKQPFIGLHYLVHNV